MPKPTKPLRIAAGLFPAEKTIRENAAQEAASASQQTKRSAYEQAEALYPRDVERDSQQSHEHAADPAPPAGTRDVARAVTAAAQPW